MRISPITLEMPAHPVSSQNPPVPHGGAGIDEDDEAVRSGDRPGAARLEFAGSAVSELQPRCSRIRSIQAIQRSAPSGRILDAGDHLELPAAAPADLDVDPGKRSDAEASKDTFEALRPGQRPLSPMRPVPAGGLET